MADGDVERNNGVVALVGAAVLTDTGIHGVGSEGGRVSIARVHLVGVFVAGVDYDGVRGRVDLRHDDVDIDGVVGDALGLEMAAVEFDAVGVGGVGAASGEGGAFGVGTAGARGEGVVYFGAAGTTDRLAVAMDEGDIDMAVEDATVDGVGGVGTDRIVAYVEGVAVRIGGVGDIFRPAIVFGTTPRIAVAAVFNCSGVVLVVGVTDDADGSEAVASGGGGEGAAVDDIGVGVVLTGECVVAASGDIGHDNVGGVGIDGINGEVQVASGGAAIGSGAVGVVATGGKCGVPSGVGAAGGDGVELNDIAVEVGDLDAHGAVTAVGSGEDEGVHVGVGDFGVVPSIGAMGSHFFGGSGVRVVDSQVEHIVAQAAVDGGVLDDIGRGIEHFTPGSEKRVADGEGLASAVDAGQYDVETYDAVAATGCGHHGIKSAGGGEHRVAEGDAASTAELHGVNSVVGGCCHGDEQHIGSVALQEHHSGVVCVGLTGEIPVV